MFQLIAQRLINPQLSTGMQGITGWDLIQTWIPNFINLGLIIGIVVFFFMLVIGGISWITAGGDKGKLESAKNKITNALIGLFLLLLLFTLMQVINILFGTNIGNIGVPQGPQNSGPPATSTSIPFSSPTTVRTPTPSITPFITVGPTATGQPVGACSSGYSCWTTSQTCTNGSECEGIFCLSGGRVGQCCRCKSVIPPTSPPTSPTPIASPTSGPFRSYVLNTASGRTCSSVCSEPGRNLNCVGVDYSPSSSVGNGQYRVGAFGTCVSQSGSCASTMTDTGVLDPNYSIQCSWTYCICQ